MSLKDQINALAALNGASVETGWFDTNTYPDGTSVAQVAYWNEFGTKTSPARPFMRLALSESQIGIKSIAASGAKAVLSGKSDPEAVLGKIGLYFERQIVKSIKNGPWEPNSEVTVYGSGPAVYDIKSRERIASTEGFIKGKGFNKPLIDTGLMWQSVSSKVTLKGK